MITKEQKEYFRKQTGKVFERKRLEAGLSRKELGEALGYADNSAIQIVARFESGRAGVPKSKIDLLLQTLKIENKDFGIEQTKSLKNFITSSGFFGSTKNPWMEQMVNWMDAGEANFQKMMLVDDDEPNEEEPDQKLLERYQGVSRLIRLLIAKEEVELDNTTKLTMLGRLAEGDENRLAQLLELMEIDPEEASSHLEQELINLIKKS